MEEPPPVANRAVPLAPMIAMVLILAGFSGSRFLFFSSTKDSSATWRDVSWCALVLNGPFGSTLVTAGTDGSWIRFSLNIT